MTVTTKEPKKEPKKGNKFGGPRVYEPNKTWEIPNYRPIAPTVEHTTNYDSFRILAGNRAVSDYHVRQLAESYAKNPNLIELRPVLVNERMENIGARRLHTVLERLLEEISFTATDKAGETIVVDAAYVNERVAPLAEKGDLSRFIL